MPATLAQGVNFTLKILGKDVSASLNPYLKRVRFTSNTEGEADDFSATLVDPDGRFLGDWLPPIGAFIEFQIGYVGAAATPLRKFELDAPEVSYSRDGGSEVTLKAKSVPVSRPMGTKGTKDYEETNLKAIAQSVADDLKLTLKGEVRDIPIKRATRKDETPLEFLRRLSEKYGLILKVQDTTDLVLFDLEKLDGQSPAFTLDLSDMLRFTLKRNSREKYTKCVCTYSDPSTGKTYSGEALASDSGAGTPSGAGQSSTAIPSEDGDTKSAEVLQVRERCESDEQAKEIARAKLRRANADELELSFTLSGDPRCQPGVMVTIQGIGRFSGNYLIQSVTQDGDCSQGYKTQATAEKRTGR